jgi:filamentous hemagglutinin family protein
MAGRTAPRLVSRTPVFICVLAVLLGWGTLPLRAQPTGGQVVAGAATISFSPGALTVSQTSARAVINWQDFSLAAGDTARFIQPDATSATLNRVVSGLPSSLAGTLQANGLVYLINPNGILIGAGARVDTGGFLASTLDVSDREFFAGGDLHFAGDSTAAIMNLGQINALGGDIFLIAQQVENRGAITAAHGIAGLAAGSEILLTSGGDERLFIHAASMPGAIVNSGSIAATTAELRAAGGNAFALAINNSGTVRATGSAVRNGQVWLVANSGEVVSSGTLIATSADGTHGGDVRLLGDQVTLAAGALVDVSGTLGGGAALIGGDFQGKNPAVPNAQTTTVASGAVLRADAVTSGNGGKVVVWSDDTTRFDGAISAHGGATGGDGGFAEVSGKNLLVYRGFADLRATAGATGTLLLDPTNITISGAGADSSPTSGSFSGGVFDGGANPSSTISIGSGAGDTNNTLLKQLSAANVVITTTSAGAGTGSLVVSGAISYNSANSLTLTAGSTLTVNSPITNAGPGALTLNSDNGIAINANVTTAGITTLNADQNNDGTGTLTVANNITVATGGTALNITAADVALVFFGALNSGAAPTTITASAGRSIGLGGTAGGLSLTNTEFGHITAGGVSLDTTGLAGDVMVDGITFGGSINSGLVTINAGGKVTFANNGSTFFKGVTVNANDGIAAGADITALNGNILLDGDADSTATPRDGITFTGTRILSASSDGSVPYDLTQGSITLRNGVAGTNGDIASAALSLTAANNITISDDLTATGGTFSATANPGGYFSLGIYTGIITVAGGKTIATVTSGDINLTASDVVLDGSLNSVAAASVNGSNNMAVDLGSPVYNQGESVRLGLSDTELGRITATSLTIGIDITGLAAIHVGGLSAANTDQFGPLTLTTPGYISIDGTSVVGNRLTATGDSGIVFITGANLATSTAATSDPDLTLAGNNLLINASVTVTAGGTGTLTLSPTDTFVVNGDLTLESGDHLAINRALSVPGFLVINADKNNDGTGTFTVADGITVQTTGGLGHPISITAADVTLGTGALNSGQAETFITASAGRSIGLGATVMAGGLNVAGSELQQITATGLTLTSIGNIVVDGISEPNSNNIAGTTTLTASGGSSTVTFANNDSTFNALTVNSTGTIANNATLTLDVGNLSMNAGSITGGSDITQTGAIEIGAGTASFSGATITLAHANNTMGDVTVVSGAGDVSIREDGAISVAGITRTSGNLMLNAAGNLTQTGAISIATGTANLTAASITLNSANVLGALTLNATAGNISVTEADAMAIAAITAPFDLSLTAAGAITDSGVLTVNGSTTLTAGAANDIILDSANDFGTVVVTSGNNVTLNDRNALALGNVTATGSFLATAAGNLTLNSGATIAAAGAGPNPLVLVAGGNFVNNAGAAVLAASAGRWLVYSTSPAGSTENGLTAVAGSTSPRLYNRTYAGNAPATIIAGNHLVYSTQPTVLVTAGNQTRLYGDANGAFTATISGAFLTDDGVTDNATSAGFAGTAGLSSLATAASAVSGSPYAITATVGSLASSAGYGFNFTDGALMILVRPVTVTATPGQTRVYGTADPSPLAYSTTSLGGGIALGGSLTRTAGSTVNGGPYAITQGTVTNANNPNYDLTYVGANFAITPATLTYTANTASRFVGGSDPVFGGTVTGFVNLETQASATTGLRVFTTTATGASVAGLYPINGSGLTATNGNYVFVQAPGNAVAYTIGAQAALIITAADKAKTYGAALPTFTATYAGFINGDTAVNVTGLQFSTTATLGSNVGTFTITPFGATAPAYYLVGYVPGTLIINPAALTLTAGNASRFFGVVNPAFSGVFAGLVNGDTADVVSGQVYRTSATVASPAGDYAIAPLGATAANYTITLVNGILHVIPPSVNVGTTSHPVVIIDDQPVFTPDLAVVLLDDRLVLVSTDGPDGFSGSLGDRLMLTLGDITSPGKSPTGVLSANLPNLGGFELASSSGSDSPGSSRLNELGLFRESSVNMGGFNVIYHEALADVRRQAESNTALGSSYREFSDSDNPQVNLVRAKVERKPTDPTSGYSPDKS